MVSLATESRIKSKQATVLLDLVPKEPHVTGGSGKTSKPMRYPPRSGEIYKSAMINFSAALTEMPRSKIHQGGFFRNLSKRFSRLRKNELDNPRFQFQSFPSNQSRENLAEMESESLLHDKISLDFLERMWARMKEYSSLSGGCVLKISYNDFLKICRKELEDPTPEELDLLGKLYKRVDRKNKGKVKTLDIATAMVLICTKASRQDKLQLLFRAFGQDDDSCLTPDEIFDLYFTIKVNDLTKDPCKARADLIFNDELSLQDAKRFYELTITPMLNTNEPRDKDGDGTTDFVILEEFLKVFEARPHLLESLLPGSFSFRWVLHNKPDENIKGAVGDFQNEVVSNFVKVLRKGDEHLDLSKRRGRGRRIVHGAENNQVVQGNYQSAKPRDPKKRQDQCAPSGLVKKGKLPKLTSSKREETRHESGTYSDSSSSENETISTQKRVVARKVEEKRTAYNIEDVELPDIPWLSLQHKNGTLFRELRGDRQPMATSGNLKSWKEERVAKREPESSKYNSSHRHEFNLD